MAKPGGRVGEGARREPGSGQSPGRRSPVSHFEYLPLIDPTPAGPPPPERPALGSPLPEGGPSSDVPEVSTDKSMAASLITNRQVPPREALSLQFLKPEGLQPLLRASGQPAGRRDGGGGAGRGPTSLHQSGKRSPSPSSLHLKNDTQGEGASAHSEEDPGCGRHHLNRRWRLSPCGASFKVRGGLLTDQPAEGLRRWAFRAPCESPQFLN